MRRAALLAALLGLLAACGGSAAGSNPGQSRPRPDNQSLAASRAKADLGPCPTPAAAKPARAELPDLTLPCLGGGADVPLARLGGVPMVINAWAAWCAPCREELPNFQQLASAVPAGTLRVLGVDSEDAPQAALDFAAARGVHIPTVVDNPAALKSSRRLPGLPFTMFVRADGSVASVHVGPLTYAQLTAAVDEHLGVRVA
jgi:thiol-disulfide isomerase/thioredoxin